MKTYIYFIRERNQVDIGQVGYEIGIRFFGTALINARRISALLDRKTRMRLTGVISAALISFFPHYPYSVSD